MPIVASDIMAGVFLFLAYAFAFINRYWISLFIYTIFFTGAVVAYDYYFAISCNSFVECAFGNLGSPLIVASGIAGIVARAMTLILRGFTRRRLAALGKHENAAIAGRKLWMIGLFIGFPVWVMILPLFA